jgi:hypothetical protein
MLIFQRLTERKRLNIIAKAVSRAVAVREKRCFFVLDIKILLPHLNSERKEDKIFLTG